MNCAPPNCMNVNRAAFFVKMPGLAADLLSSGCLASDFSNAL